jgi:hypothetical protein
MNTGHQLWHRTRTWLAVMGGQSPPCCCTSHHLEGGMSYIAYTTDHVSAIMTTVRRCWERAGHLLCGWHLRPIQARGGGAPACFTGREPRLVAAKPGICPVCICTLMTCACRRSAFESAPPDGQQGVCRPSPFLTCPISALYTGASDVQNLTDRVLAL